MPDKKTIIKYFKSLQDAICASLEEADGKAKFQEDAWEHHSGGGGRSRVIQNGIIIEKGGVNFSAVEGTTTEAMKKQLNINADANFTATGVSIVIHPKNPWVPIIHMNVRYFELSSGAYWFGGGIDLTPHYIDREDAKFFHTELKKTCDRFGTQLYLDYKKYADDYFYLPHREETRGIGGIFFDHLTHEHESFDDKHQVFEYVKAVGETFAPVYTALMRKNYQRPFDNKHLAWQALRRGRYVEFNLVWDRGTKFGLVSKGRTESILMSMPPVAQWEYNHQPSAGTEEFETLSLLKKGIDWV